MWKFIAHSILKNRIAYLVVLGLITVFFAFESSKIQLSYQFARTLPQTDSALIEYDDFLKRYGQDGTVMVIGFENSDVFELNTFNQWDRLYKQIKGIDGVKNVLCATNLYAIQRNDSLQKFDFVGVAKKNPTSQAEADSIRRRVKSLPFYKGLVFGEGSSTLMMITFEEKALNSQRRLAMVSEIKELGLKFSSENKIDLHYSGMPYIRASFMKKVSHEMGLFLVLTILVTAVIMFIVFKSFKIVGYSLVVVIVGILWSLGIIVLFDYKITILSGMIPPLITVIGLPNCVFIINKYQVELGLHGNKIKAIYNSIVKVGFSNFLANLTTAIGFGVFYFTDSSMLVEFGVVAAINVMATYAVAHILIPIILSYSAKPDLKHTRHLTGKRINKVLEVVSHLILNKRKQIYWTMFVLTLISFYGMTKVNLVGYMLDDLPQKDPIYTDLRFFEKNFHGVMPFEIAIDTKQAKGVFGKDGTTIYKMKALQREMEQYPEFTKPLSLVEAVKFSYQSYRGGDPKYYVLPGVMDLAKLKEYTGSVSGQSNKFSSFLDSSMQHTRISYQMADVGSKRMKELVKEIRPKVDSIFPKDKYNVSITGNSFVFLKGNDYLFHHLFVSLLIAIGLILLVGMALFQDVLIIIMSKIPCLIPLVITAGIMGFFGIRFKPSTILIFSIAFGLASDGTIYILAEYWNELKNKGITDHSLALSNTVKEVGVSMVYTAAILFFGFALFIASDFGGTVALGVLMSITIAMALATNLVMLPSILLTLALNKEKRKNKK